MEKAWARFVDTLIERYGMLHTAYGIQTIRIEIVDYICTYVHVCRVASRDRYASGDKNNHYSNA